MGFLHRAGQRLTRSAHTFRYFQTIQNFSTAPSATFPTGPPAFVFDIDGVLTRGKVVLPQAKVAVLKLFNPSVQQWRFPVCFITNGGGMEESRKADQLTRWLDVPVNPQQVILSHTPMRNLVTTLGRQPVLLSGHNRIADVALNYGFSQTITTEQLAAAIPEAVPFCKHFPSGMSPSSDPLPSRLDQVGAGTQENPFRAIMVLNDPADWYRDLQLLTDVILGRGVLGTMRPEGSAALPVYFSNPDLVWANDFPTPRYGQGAFSTALIALIRRLTGRDLEHVTFFGKPNPEPYRLAEQLLLNQARELGLVPSSMVPGRSHTAEDIRCMAGRSFSGIFAVGDNPCADVRGANKAGAPWVSVLVRTGVFSEGASLNSSSTWDVPHVLLDDVNQAVDMVLQRIPS